MKQRSIAWANILTLSGTLPLIASVVLIFFPLAGVNSALIVTSYGAVIISFLCGIHWAVYLFFEDKCPHHLLITSNAVALLAWASLLIPNPPIAILLQASCFLYLLALDARLREAGIIPEWFYSLRRNATIIVVLCLALVAGFA